MARGQQVRDREVAAEHVVDRDRALAAGRRPAVDEHHGGAPPLQPGQPRARAGHRRDQHALHPVRFEQPQEALLLALLVIAVAQDDRQPGLAGLVLHPACHVGEERVGHVEHDKPDRPAVPGAQLARGLVPDEPELPDRRVHPVAGLLSHDFGPVEHVRDRGDGDAGVRGDLPDADRHVYPLLDWTDRQSEARYWNVSNLARRCGGSACSIALAVWQHGNALHALEHLASAQ